MEKALVLVDIQEGFREAFHENGFNSMVENSIELIEEMKKRNYPIYNFKAPGFGETDPRIKNAINGYPEARTLSKKLDADDCFTNKNLDEELQSRYVKELILAGLSGPYCVKSTADSALSRGYKINSAEGLVIAQKNESKKMEDFESWFYRSGKYYDSTQELIENLD